VVSQVSKETWGTQHREFKCDLKFFVEFAGRARDIDSAGSAALAVLDALDDAGGFRALGAIGGLGRIHYLFAVAGFCNFSHGLGGSPLWVSLHASAGADGFNGAVVVLALNVRGRSRTRWIKFT
jgi:hypothetical protein